MVLMVLPVLMRVVRGSYLEACPFLQYNSNATVLDEPSHYRLMASVGLIQNLGDVAHTGIQAELTFRQTSDAGTRQTNGPKVCASNSTIEWNQNFVGVLLKVNDSYFCGENASKWNYSLVLLKDTARIWACQNLANGTPSYNWAWFMNKSYPQVGLDDMTTTGLHVAHWILMALLFGLVIMTLCILSLP